MKHNRNPSPIPVAFLSVTAHLIPELRLCLVGNRCVLQEVLASLLCWHDAWTPTDPTRVLHPKATRWQHEFALHAGSGLCGPVQERVAVPEKVPHRVYILVAGKKFTVCTLKRCSMYCMNIVFCF